MTMIDEDELRAILQQAAGAIEPPKAGADAILAAAVARKHPHPSTRSIRPRSLWGRAAVVAAVIVLVVVGISFMGGGATHRQTSASPSAVAPSTHRPSAPSSSPNVPQGGTAQGSTAQGSTGNSGAVTSPAATSPPTLPPGSVGQSAKVETTGSVDLAI